MSTTLEELLREAGLDPEDFPEALRTNPTLIRYAEDLPHPLRAEYLDALRGFFQVYESLDAERRQEMLEQLGSSLLEAYERKRVAHDSFVAPSLDSRRLE